jgi:hypothetical protein
MDDSKSRDAWKIVKPATACSAGRPATAGTLLISGLTAAAGTIGTSWMSTAARPPEPDSRDVSNRSRISQLEH